MRGPVLVVRFSAIGDCVMAAWAVSELRRAGVGPLVWAVQERCAPVVAAPGLVDEVVWADRDAWKRARWSPATWRGQLRVWAGLRKRGFEVGLDFQGHSKTAMCLRLSGAKRRYASRATDALAGRLNQLVDCGSGRRHEIEVAQGLLREVFGLEPSGERPIMPDVSPGPRCDVSIQTGAGHRDKTVAVKVWEDVARELVRRGVLVTALGGPGDPAIAVEGVTNLGGQLSLQESMGVLRASRVHVAADTGSGHLAGAYGVPLVSVFGATDPDIYAPRGSRAEVLSAGPGMAIEPGEVVSAAMGLMEGA